MRILFLLLATIGLAYSGIAQVDCKTLDINKVPGQWVWNKVGYGNQWINSEPIRKEMQRIMPKALDGLHATNSIAFGENKAFWYANSPATYENFLKLKKFECLKSYNKLQPEGETGCWVYFVVNQIEGESFPIPGTVDKMRFHAYESNIRVLNINIETDAAGNKILYTQHRDNEFIKHGYYFSARKDLPLRRISNKELFTSYKIHHEKRVNEQIVKFEKLVADDEKKYSNLSVAEKQIQNYWPDIIKKNKEYLKVYKIEKELINTWFSNALNNSNINATAYVSTVNSFLFNPEKLVASSGNGFNVWVDNLNFFDSTKPKDAPQCIVLNIREQPSDLPKQNFIELFYSQFNLDILSKMAGEAPKKPNGINTIASSQNEMKAETASQKTNALPTAVNFESYIVGSFPKDWQGMNNVTVQPFENKKWLALNKNGYWFPKQFNNEIKDNFSLSFDLAWNKEIPYSSGLFTVTFSDIPYDNAGQRYIMDGNANQYWSLYDSYVGKFNRVVLWFDPYWNSGGSLTVYAYDKNEAISVNKRITLPDFYMAKNMHKVKIQRKGNSLIVIINDKKEAEVENVFLPAVKYNLYTFSRYKGSDDKNDVFYLNNIKTEY